MTLRFTAAPASPPFRAVLARLFCKIEGCFPHPGKRRAAYREAMQFSNHMRRDIGLEQVERSVSWEMLR